MRDVALIGGVAVAFAAMIRLAYFFPAQSGAITALWPGSGVVLAALLLIPRALWRPLLAACFVSSVVSNLSFGAQPLLVALGFGATAVLESLGCALLIERARSTSPLFERVREVTALVVAAAGVNALTAVAGAVVATLGHGAAFATVWRTWYVSNGLGILVVTPTIVGWVEWARGASSSSGWPKSEAAAFFAVWIAAIWLGLHPVGDLSLRPYMALVLLAWPALRLPVAVAPTAVLLMGGITIGEFVSNPQGMLFPGLMGPTDMLWIQIFTAAAAVTALVMSSMRAETRAALAAARREADVARSEHARLQLLLDTMVDGIHVLDPSGKLVLWGESFLRGLGYTPEEAASLHVFDWDHHLPPERIMAEIERLMVQPSLIETRHRRKDGTEFDVEIIARGVVLDGKPLLYAASRDMTERRRAEARLRASEERFRMVADAAPVMMWMLSPRLERLFANENWFRFVGEDRKTSRVDSWPAVIHPDDLPRVLEESRRGLETLEPFSLEFRVLRHDGEYRWLLARGAATRDIAEDERVIVGSAFDITEMRAAEERLRVSEADLRAAERTANLGHWTWEPITSSWRFSDELLRILGTTRAEAMLDPNTVLTRAIHPDDLAYAMEAWADATQGADVEPRELRAIRFDGEVRLVRSTVAVTRREGSDIVTAVSGVVQDITEARRVQEALREANLRWQFAVEGTGDGLWDWDVIGGHVYYSDQWKAMLGYGPDEVGTSLEEWSSRVHPDDLGRATSRVEAHLRGDTPRYECEHRMRCKDGTWKWVHDRGVVIRRDDEGAPLRIIGTHRDITERKEAEAALLDSEARFRALADSAPVLVWVTDAADRVTTFNRHWAEFTGIVDGRTFADDWAKAMHPDDFPRCSAQYDAAIAAREAYDMEFRLRRRDGEYRWIFERGMPRFNPEGEYLGYVGAGVDVTEQVELRAALTAAREAADSANRAKTEFLANMSHEIRTPLNGVLGHVQLLGATPLTQEQQANLQAVTQSANNLLSILNDLLDLSKIEAGRVTLNPAEFSVPACLESIVGLMKPRAAAKGLTLQLEVRGDVPRRLVGDELRVRQILQNLVANAVKFTLQGSVSVTASALEQGDHEVILKITVADTGVGIAPAAMERIFEPFVQADSSITRRFGSTGLGLSIARRLAHQMGGSIDAQSVEGVGSVFQVMLPLAKPPAARPSSSKSAVGSV